MWPDLSSGREPDNHPIGIDRRFPKICPTCSAFQRTIADKKSRRKTPAAIKSVPADQQRTGQEFTGQTLQTEVVKVVTVDPFIKIWIL
jgi:hypothetical protein